MTTNRTIAVADAIVAALNGRQFSLPFQARRDYVPHLDLTALETLHVTVVPKDTVSELVARQEYQERHEVDIAVQQRLPQKESEFRTRADALMGLAQEIRDYLGDTDCPVSGLAPIEIRSRPIYAVEHLLYYRAFTSILTVTYQ